MAYSNISSTTPGSGGTPRSLGSYDVAKTSCSSCPRRGGSGGGLSQQTIVRIIGLVALVALVAGAIAFGVWIHGRQ